MAITSPIPLPESGMDAFLNEIQRGQENKLRQAQMEALQGKAAQSQMLARLINQAITGSSPGGSSQGGMDNSLLLSGLLGLPTHTIEGKLVTPFGTKQIGETPEEKGKREVKESGEKKAAASSVSTQQALENQADSLINAAMGYNKLASLHKANPGLTHPWAGFKVEHGLTNSKELGEYAGTAKDIQAQLAKGLSTRGGVGILQSAGTMKPHVGNREKFNLGMISSGWEKMLNDMTTVNNRYKELTGKNLPQYEKLLSLNADYKKIFPPKNYSNLSPQMQKWIQEAIDQDIDPAAIDEEISKMGGGQ